MGEPGVGYVGTVVRRWEGEQGCPVLAVGLAVHLPVSDGGDAGEFVAWGAGGIRAVPEGGEEVDLGLCKHGSLFFCVLELGGELMDWKG